MQVPGPATVGRRRAADTIATMLLTELSIEPDDFAGAERVDGQARGGVQG